MRRRKYLAAIGSIAAGAAAASGTGAFTAASIVRNADVTVANDSSAFIQLVPGGGPGVGKRVGTKNGELYIDLNSGDGAGSGTGVNDQARYQLGAMNDDGPDQGGPLGDGIPDFESIYDDDTAGDPAVAPGTPLANDGTDQSAFVVKNRSGQTLDLQIGLEGNQPTGVDVFVQAVATDIAGAGSGSPSTLEGAQTTLLDLDDINAGGETETDALSYNDDNDPNEAIPPGEEVYVSLLIDTRGEDTPDGASVISQLVVNAEKAAEPGVE